jgi:peptidoglycan/LPS O-acetylase OafA/YrhL
MINGSFWVDIFFILSGFVLTVGYFKTRDVKIIIGGTFKRYVRLLIPVMAIFPFYVAIKTLDKNDIYEKCSKKYLSEFLLDIIYGTWLNKSGYTYAAWTLPHELFCSYFAFQIAFIVTNINHRWIAYLSVFLFMLEPIVY